MNILIIGGAGYIGGVTAHIAHEAGHTVTVADDLSTGHRHNLPDGVILHKGDVRDRAFAQDLFANTRYDAVMHFAAKIQVGESMQQPFKYFTANTAAALNCIDAAAQANVGCYIFSSTAAVYGEPVHIPITEDDPTQPVNPYGTSKLLTEQLLASYHTTHNLQWAALRYFNVVGAYAGVGTDYPFISHIVPALLDAMGTHKPIAINGNDYDTPDGTCIRDYTHVVDIARAHLLAAEAIISGKVLNQPVNLGSHHGYSVKEVIDTFQSVTKANVPLTIGPRRAGDPARLIASNQRAKQLLNWEPQYDLKKAIQDHYNWYQSSRLGTKSATITA